MSDGEARDVEYVRHVSNKIVGLHQTKSLGCDSISSLIVILVSGPYTALILVIHCIKTTELLTV